MKPDVSVITISCWLVGVQSGLLVVSNLEKMYKTMNTLNISICMYRASLSEKVAKDSVIESIPNVAENFGVDHIICGETNTHHMIRYICEL